MVTEAILTSFCRLGRAFGKDERRLLRLQVSHNHELHKVLPEALEPGLGHCRDQEDVDAPQDSIKTRACRGMRK